jgi:hypothetical protein
MIKISATAQMRKTTATKFIKKLTANIGKTVIFISLTNSEQKKLNAIR